MNNYYIDLSTQNSSDLLKNNNNLLNYNNDNNSNLNNKGDLIEGFGNFGRVNLEKCCPLEYMWSENQKKCVKICDGCAIGAYGNINYEFLHNHGDEFMSFAQCVGDASEAYDFDKINKRYGINELITQHDLNFHIDSDENASGVQPSEENPWAPVTSGMYQVSSTNQQMNIREDDTWDTYLDCDEDGNCETATGTFRRETDEQRYGLQDGTLTEEDIQQQEIEEEQERTERLQRYRNTICSSTNIEIPYTVSINSEDVTDYTNPGEQYLLCNDDRSIGNGWTTLCGLDDFSNLNFGNICDNEDIRSLCNNIGDDVINVLDERKICQGNT